MKRPSYLTLAIIAGAVLLLSVVAFKRYLPYTGMNLAPKQPPGVVLAMDNAYLVGLGHNGKLWSIKAKKVEISQDRVVTTVSGITDGKIYDKGKIALKVRAGRATYNTYIRDLVLTNGVRIESLDGQTISGPGASWNSAMGMLRSQGPVTVETKWSTLTADPLIVDLRNKEMCMWRINMRVNMRQADGLLDKETTNVR